MIYFDNAATSLVKPPEVAQAVVRAMSTLGNVGRGVHAASLGAGMSVFECRCAVNELLGGPGAGCVAFGPNVTWALNTAVAGLLRPGEGALTTAASHNSVLRPLFRARDERGCTVDVAPHKPDGALDWDAYEALLFNGAPVASREPVVPSAPRGPVRLVVATHASNLTGDVYDAARMARLAHEAGALFVLDCAQTAGAIPVDMAALGADVLCFTGHKSLLGPQGTGGLIAKPGVEIAPLLEGGTGIRSFEERQPREMPESLEAGTLNAHGLAGLAAGIAYLQRTGVAEHAAYVEGLTRRFEEGVLSCPGVVVYGGHAGVERTGIVALNVADADPALVSSRLSEKYGICTRPGAHCAPLMHKALGTQDRGAVRFSFSHFNTPEEIDTGVAAIREIAQELTVRGGLHME